MSTSVNQPSFFKVLVGDFLTELLIPVEFTRRYKHLLPEKCHLETEYRKHTWIVKIEQINVKKHCFTEGWPEFVRGNRLEEYDFLVFEVVRKSTFKVAIFSRTGCEKGSPLSHVDASASTTETPRFSLKLHQHNKYFIRFPVGFAQKTGLARKNAIRLRDGRGVEWPVMISKDISTNGLLQIQSSRGWNEYLAAQGLYFGNVISIESVPGSGDVFQVKVLENGVTGEPITAIKRNMRRPRRV